MKMSVALLGKLSFPLVQNFVNYSSVICVLFHFTNHCVFAGKKGHLAFQRMDQLYTEMQEEAYQNQETQITYL